MAILTTADYPAIRAALDTTLDDTLLPDATIALDPYHWAAEREVLRRDPDAESRTGDDAKRVKLAAVYYAAANLAPAIPRITASALSTTSFQAKYADWSMVAALRRAEAGKLLRDVLGTTRSGQFGRASGDRGIW